MLIGDAPSRDAIHKRLRDCQNALRHLRTDEKLAVRRYGEEDDPDLGVLGQDSPCATDDFQKIMAGQGNRRRRKKAGKA